MKRTKFIGRPHREEWEYIYNPPHSRITYGELENAIMVNQNKLQWLQDHYPQGTPEMEELKEQLNEQKVLFERMNYDI